MPRSKEQAAADLAAAELTALERIDAMDDDTRRRFLTWLATHGGDAFILLVQMDKFDTATLPKRRED